MYHSNRRQDLLQATIQEGFFSTTVNCLRCSVRVGAYRNFAKILRKNTCARALACNFIEKETLSQAFL